MKRSILMVLFLFSVILAGCSGFLPSNNETPADTATPANVPTDEPTQTPIPQLAPGLTGQGVTDGFALGEAHAAVLENTSYTVSRNTTVRYTNGTVGGRLDGVFRVAKHQSKIYHQVNISGQDQPLYTNINRSNGSAQIKEFSNGNRTVQAITHDDTTSYHAGPASIGWITLDSSDPTNSQQISTLLSSAKTVVTGQENQNGTTLYRVEATNITNKISFKISDHDPQKIGLQALVDSRGLVHEYHLRFVTVLHNNTVQVQRDVSYTHLGDTTVERPPWYDTAIKSVSNSTSTEQ